MCQRASRVVVPYLAATDHWVNHVMGNKPSMQASWASQGRMKVTQYTTRTYNLNERCETEYLYECLLNDPLSCIIMYIDIWGLVLFL